MPTQRQRDSWSTNHLKRTLRGTIVQLQYYNINYCSSPLTAAQINAAVSLLEEIAIGSSIDYKRHYGLLP